MKCPNCGKELTVVADLTEDEISDFYYANNIRNTAQQALRNDSIDFSLFQKEGQVFEYFRAAYHEMATAEFLFYTLYSSLAKKYNISKKDINHLVIEDGKLCIHEHN